MLIDENTDLDENQHPWTKHINLEIVAEVFLEGHVLEVGKPRESCSKLQHEAHIGYVPYDLARSETPADTIGMPLIRIVDPRRLQGQLTLL